MPDAGGLTQARPGAVLKEQRLARGWTLADVSARTGLPVSTLSKVENDKISLTYDKLVRLSQGLGIDISRLFGGADAPQRAVTGRRSVTRSTEGRAIETRNYGHRYVAADLLNKGFIPIVAEVRARSLAKRLDNAPLAIVDKRRERAGESEVMNIIGEVDGRCCILVDDIVDSAGTLCNAAAALKSQGATDVYAYCSHGVLSGGAAARVQASELSELVVTDTIYPGEPDNPKGKIRRLTIAPLFGEAIQRIADEASVSSLFD